MSRGYKNVCRGMVTVFRMSASCMGTQMVGYLAVLVHEKPRFSYAVIAFTIALHIPEATGSISRTTCHVHCRSHVCAIISMLSVNYFSQVL